MSETARGGVVAVIPARYASKRFPGKVLADLNGHPLVWHVYRQVIKAIHVSWAVVATDDERVMDALPDIPVVLTGEHFSGTDRVAAVIQDLDFECDAVVNIQGDQPFVPPSVIDAVVGPVATYGTNMCTARTLIRNPEEVTDPNVVKVVCSDSGKALYFSRSPIPYDRDGEGWLHYKHIGVYAYTPKFLNTFTKSKPGLLEQAEKLEQLRALEYGYPIQVVDVGFNSNSVDTPADLEKLKSH